MKYSLKNNSVSILRQLLTVPGACSDIDDIYLGGKLLSELPKATGKEGEGADALLEIEVDGPQRDVVKKALTVALQKQMVPASEYVVDIIEKLELRAKK